MPCCEVACGTWRSPLIAWRSRRPSAISQAFSRLNWRRSIGRGAPRSLMNHLAADLWISGSLPSDVTNGSGISALSTRLTNEDSRIDEHVKVLSLSLALSLSFFEAADRVLPPASCSFFFAYSALFHCALHSMFFSISTFMVLKQIPKGQTNRHKKVKQIITSTVYLYQCKY